MYWKKKEVEKKFLRSSPIRRFFLRTIRSLPWWPTLMTMNRTPGYGVDSVPSVAVSGYSIPRNSHPRWNPKTGCRIKFIRNVMIVGLRERVRRSPLFPVSCIRHTWSGHIQTLAGVRCVLQVMRSGLIRIQNWRSARSVMPVSRRRQRDYHDSLDISMVNKRCV